tara:strand:- start:3207 stop:3812 length:606 start_codon:yes stop_codon:yes gene_type:complete
MDKCFIKRKRVSIYQDNPRPRWQRILFYCICIIGVVVSSVWILRDTSSVEFVPSSLEDLDRPRGEMATQAELNSVYWRINIRATSTKMEEICSQKKYNLMTHKNIKQDGVFMPQSYIFLCNPIRSLRSVINARAVISQNPESSVRCKETYGNKTKYVQRSYPFSLKYISSQTFEPGSRVVRSPEEACTWLHAIDIVESIWD